MQAFGLIEALLSRRSLRFFMGAEIPDGVFSYKSRYDPLPLSELEKLLVVTACGGNTGWHYMIYRAQLYAPYLANYAGSAGGRTFPSAAGFHTSMTFFTDDQEVPHTEAHNTWVFNRPGTLLVIPVGDLAQHVLLNLCYMLQNGLVLMDDINRRSIPGIENFKNIVDINNT